MIWYSPWLQRMKIRLSNMEPVFGIKYTLWIPDEPHPKSTQKPPVIRKRMSAKARAFVIQKIINEDDKYAPLRKTQAYQQHVCNIVLQANLTFPQFDKLDPIMLSFKFYKGMHAVGDLKNLKAGVEDGLQHSGKIPNDGQVTAHGESRIFYYNDEPGAEVVAQIDPMTADYDWLYRHFKKNRRQTERYIAMRYIKVI